MTLKCQCCLSSKNLVMLTERYSQLLLYCFRIEFSLSKCQKFICNPCVEKVKETSAFRYQILISQSKLKQSFSSTTSNIDVKFEPEVLIIETENPHDTKKENIIYIDIDDEPPTKNNFKRKTSVQIDQKVKSQKCTLKSESPIEEKVMKIENITHDSNKADSDIQANPKDEPNTPILDSEPLFEEAFSPDRDSSSDSDASWTKMPVLPKTKEKDPNKYPPFKLDKSALDCDLCDQTFTAHNLLLSHMGVHFPNYVCDVCGKPFVNKKSLNLHAKTHEDLVTCTVCHEKLKPTSMKVHMKNHSVRTKRYPCTMCSERFVSRCTHLLHLKNSHGVDIYKYHCKLCSRKFYTISSLKIHIRKDHNKEKRKFCSVCDMGFYDNRHLSKHMTKHTGERNYACHICPKKYASQFGLHTHLKSHADVVEKYMCSYCGNGFTQRCSLRTHIRKQHGALLGLSA